MVWSTFNSLVNQRLGSFRFVESLPCFRGHVVLIMLGHDQISMKYSVRTYATLGNAAAALFEQVRLDSFIDNGDAIGGIGYRKVDGETILVLFQTSGFDQATDAEGFARHGLFCRDVRWTQEESDVAV